MRRLAEGMPPHRHALRETGGSFSWDVSACNDPAIPQTTVFRQSLVMTLAVELRKRIRACWRADTSSDPTGWSVSNPAWGQCAVTACVVHDVLGGRIVWC